MKWVNPLKIGGANDINSLPSLSEIQSIVDQFQRRFRDTLPVPLMNGSCLYLDVVSPEFGLQRRLFEVHCEPKERSEHRENASNSSNLRDVPQFLSNVMDNTKRLPVANGDVSSPPSSSSSAVAASKGPQMTVYVPPPYFLLSFAGAAKLSNFEVSVEKSTMSHPVHDALLNAPDSSALGQTVLFMYFLL